MYIFHINNLHYKHNGFSIVNTVLHYSLIKTCIKSLLTMGWEIISTSSWVQNAKISALIYCSQDSRGQSGWSNWTGTVEIKLTMILPTCIFHFRCVYNSITTWYSIIQYIVCNLWKWNHEGWQLHYMYFLSPHSVCCIHVWTS